MGSRFSVGSLGFFIVLWVLMMAAMMFPSVWPAVVGLVGLAVVALAKPSWLPGVGSGVGGMNDGANGGGGIDTGGMTMR